MPIFPDDKDAIITGTPWNQAERYGLHQTVVSKCCRHRIRAAGLMLVALTAISGQPAQGQLGCQAAAQAAVSDPFSLEGTMALGKLRGCGAVGGQAYATLLDTHRMSTDTILLERITSFLRTFRDGTLFGRAAEVANSQSATSQARVFALRVLHWALSPADILRYGDLASPDLPCSGVPTAVLHGIHRGSAMPSNYVDIIKGVTQNVLGNPAEDARVRSAATCVRTWENSPLITDEDDPKWAVPHEVVVPYRTTLSYICGNQFRVRNTSPQEKTLTYTVLGTSETGTVVVPGKDAAVGYADALFTTRIQGGVVLRWMGTAVDERPNGNVPCS